MNKLVLASVLCAMGSTAMANPIVNMEDRRNLVQDNGLYGKADLNISGKSGNSEKSAYDYSVELRHKQDNVHWLAALAQSYGESSGVKDTDSSFAHVRYVNYVKTEYAYEVFTQYQQDEFARLSSRVLLGAGARFEDNTAKRKLAYGVGLFGEWESIEEKAGTTDAGDYDRVRANLYGSINMPISNSASWVNTVYAQPDMEDFGNVRLTNKTGIKVDVTKAVKLNFALSVSHISEPMQGLESTDTTYKTGFSYEF